MVNDFVVTAYGAVGDGVTDDSAAIRSALAAANTAGGGRVVFPNGTYLVSQDGSNAWCLDLPSNVHLIGTSRDGAVVKMSAAQAGFVRPLSAYGETAITIENLTIDGNRANQVAEEHRAGVFLNTCSRCVIRGVTSRDNTGDGFGVHAFCSDILLDDCDAVDNDRSGIAVHGGGQVRTTIRGCRLYDNGAQQIDTEFDSGYYTEDLLIEGCFLRALVSSSDFALTLSGTNVTNQSVGIVVRDCVIEGPVFVVWADAKLFGNRITTRSGDTAPPLTVFRRSRVLAHGNAITANNSAYGSFASCAIEVQGVASAADRPSVVIRDNAVIQNTAYSAGVYLNNHVDAVVDSNDIRGSSTGYSGVDTRVTVAYPSRTLTVTNNTITDFTTGVVCGSNTGTEEMLNVNVTGNTFVKDANTGANTAMDLNVDNNAVVRQAALAGNQLVGVTSLFGGTYGGQPDVPLLMGGNYSGGALLWNP